MITSFPNEMYQRRRLRTLAAALLAVAAIVGISVAAGLQRAGADPASGVGPITVDDSGHWFEYSGNGEPYFMAGSGGPEGFLYYSDSRKQSIVDQLIRNDVRAIYIHAVRSNGGDGGGDENPFFGNNPDNGVDPAVLDDWDSYLSQLDDAGIVTWFHLYDDGARPYGACNPDLPSGEQQFVKTMVERFRDYQHLVWLPTEEHIIKACSNNSTDVEKAKAIAAEIRKHDDVHPVGVHHNNGQSNQYLGNNDIDVFSQQVCQQSQFTSVDGIHTAGEFGEDVYVMAECHPWHKELLDDGQRTTLRQSFWASAMAGGYVLFYDAWESNDPTDAMLVDLGRINAFMDTTRFAETVPADQLAAGGTKWVLGNEAKDVYIAYSNENPSSMGVQGMSAGTYDLGWFDTVTGQTVSQTITVGNGTATFPVPNQIGSEVALSIEPSDGNPPVTTPPTTTPPTTAPPTTVTPTTSPPTTTGPTITPPTTVPVGPRVALNPSEDAYLQGASGFNNSQLRLEHGGRPRVGYVQFDTSNLSNASAVTLDVTVGSDPGSGTMTVSLGRGGSWTADTLDASNAPTTGDALASATGSFSPGQQISFELPANVVNGAVLDLVITHDGTGSNDVSLAASESGDGPTLIVNTDGQTPSTTTPPTTAPPVTTVPVGAPVTLNPAQDAYLQGASGFNNSQLRLEHGGRPRVGYVQFNTSGVSDASTVSLQATVGSDPGSGTMSISLGSGGSWTADALTPGNAPVAVDVLDTATGSFSPGQQVSFELPANVVNGAVLDLVITHDGIGGDDVSLAASESGDGPTLVINSDGETPPTTTPPTPTTAPPVTINPPTTAPPTTTSPTTAPPTTGPIGPNIATVTFNGSNAVIANPERGFHEGASVRDSTGGSNTSASQLESLRDDGVTLARMYIRLDDYRNGPIPNTLINNLDELFGNAREAGVKIIPRFSYNFGSAPDASVGRIEQHIDQVTPVLRRNSDVIAVMQAGFIGAWGEWHSSSNNLTNPTDRAKVRDALFGALPADRMVQFRYPANVVEFEPTPLNESDAWGNNAHSRTGHKNDCFLANEHDAGTYIPLSRKGEYYDYLSEMTEFTVMGGETCQVSAGSQRTDCPTALNELELFHWDYLNLTFYGNTIDKWRSDGCFGEINNRLGYRFEMKSASASKAVTAGGRLDVTLKVENEGFGKLYNPRPINVVLVNNANGAETRIRRIVDAREAMPLPGKTKTLDLSVNVPSNLAQGSYSLHVELPDGASSLADDPRYSIQMANAGTWRAGSGTNDLALDVVVGS